MNRPPGQEPLPGMACRDEITVQRSYDCSRGTSWDTFWARVRGIQDAQEANVAGEYGSEYALRQGLIDLSSCCEELAGGMVEPSVALQKPRKRGPRPRQQAA